MGIAAIFPAPLTLSEAVRTRPTKLARTSSARRAIAPRARTSRLVLSASASVTIPGSGYATKPTDLKTAKMVLKRTCYLTDRGAGASSEVRGMVEEAQVALESFCEIPLDFSKLEGKWRLIYTSAFDVTGIVDLGRLGGPLKVGGIFQQYSSPEVGKVQNIVEFGLPPFLELDKGVTFTVEARWESRSQQRIALMFRSAGLSDVRISPLLESLIAPAMLPRQTLQQALLIAIREFGVTVPLQTRPPMRADGRPTGSPAFQITFVDEDMFVGRAAQGSFIFMKEGSDMGSTMTNTW